MAASSHPPLHPEFQRYIDRQPYTVEFDGLRLTVDNDVFPPDMGQCAYNMARLAEEYQATTALDMGCGSGYLALALKRSGVATVWATDVHPPAVECARRNAAQNPEIGAITIVQGDLFEGIPPTKAFDLILFNQPFGPGSGDTVCGCGPDGGYQITQRFLSKAPFYLAPGGVVMMAFSDREPPENSPDRVAQRLGMNVRTLLHKYYGDANNYVFEIRPHR